MIAVSYYFWEFRRSTGLTARPLLRMAWKPIVLATGLGLVAAAVLQVAPRSWPMLTATIVAAYFAAYGIGIWAMRCVTREEIDPIWKFLKHSGGHLSRWTRNRLHRLGRFAFRLATTPEERLKHALLWRFGGGEQSDKLDLRWAAMWGWGLDRIRRNVAVAQRVRELQNGARLRVLDVGASDCGVRAFLPSQGFDVFSLDLNWENISTNGNKGRAVQADGCLLPFADGAFDVVVSVDSLEHVPPQHRPSYLDELSRVARHRVVLHFPTVGSGEFQGSRFDALFQHRYGLMLRRDKNIEEHLQNGLPDIHEIAARFPGCSVLGRENGPLWLKYMLLERIPYVSFLSGLAFLGSRSRLDTPPFHAVLLTFDTHASDPARDRGISSHECEAVAE
jgi:ubiquinone/menaquinone biosynthesis C-methylase UbiE